MKITVSHQGDVKTLRDALELYLESMENVKIFGISAAAEWNYEESFYVAHCMIGDGSDQAVIRASVPVSNASAKTRGMEYEQECYAIGHQLGDWLQDVFGPEWDYGIQLD